MLSKDGTFAPLLESILNAAMEGEIDTHLTDEERQLDNRRNGKMQNALFSILIHFNFNNIIFLKSNKKYKK